MRIIIFIAFIFWSNFLLFGQANIKTEKEESISQQEFPAEAFRQIKPLVSQSKKLRYYREINEEGINYEVKLKFDGTFYSIEFDSLNKLKDIEQLQKWDDYGGKSRSVMVAKLDSLFSDYKVMRFQLQVIPNEKLKVIETLPLQEEMILGRKYEVEIEAILKDAQSPRYYELLFDEQGKLLQQRLNAKTFNDNLIY